MSRGLRVEISTLVAVTPMCPETFIKICRDWVMRLSLTRYSGRSREPVGVLPVTFPIVGGNKSHQFFILIDNLL